VEDIAADHNDEAFDMAFMAADGERVEQRLRRMLVAAVAGIDHRAVHLLGQELDSARSMVTHHQKVGTHGVERHRRVDQRFALLHRRGRDRHVHDIGAEPLAGKLEGALRPGRGLEEEVDQRAAAQIVALFVDLATKLAGLLGKVEQPGDLGARKTFDSKEMAVRKGDVWGFGRECH
jgi:hypothetical protein